MVTRRPIFLAAALTALVALGALGPRQAAASPGAASVSVAAKQPVVQGFYEGKTIRYFNYGPIQLRPGNKVAPIWTVTNGPAGQHNIVDVVPGEPGYTPLWRVVEVRWAEGKKPRLLKSADDVERAESAGDVTVKTTSTVVNCPVLGFNQRRITGFSDGHPIHYYDLGATKVAPGNEVVPLYAVSNGAEGQHNVTGDTLAPGQTAYPPLWGIWQVTWKANAEKRLLRSFGAIQKAQAAGDVKVSRTSLVVNCPVVP